MRTRPDQVTRGERLALGMPALLLAVLGLSLLGALSAPAPAVAARHHHGTSCPGHPRKHPPCKSEEPTVTPGPVSLTAAEEADVEGVNALRAKAGVEPLHTSPLLQQIAEKRVRTMAADESDYAGETVYAETVREGICARHAHEVSGIGEHLDEAGSAPGEGDEAEDETKIYEHQTDPRFNVIGDAILESGGVVYAVEDFAHSC